MSNFSSSQTWRLSAIVLFCLASCSHVFSQLESSKWTFGHGAALDFSKGSPQVICGTKIFTSEGCASISDSKGNLLFYTDGITIWDRRSKPMPHASGLKGHLSSTQSAVIVPAPGKSELYYVFTLDSEANKGGFCYSLVDMTQNNGWGDVVEKNHQIKELCTERIVAVRHANGKDIWVIIHEYNSDAFVAYLLTDNGLAERAVVSNIGFEYKKSIFSTIGYMKISSDKKMIAVAINGERMLQLFRFNAETGILSGCITLKMFGGNTPYGVEFSPDNKLLYVSTVKTGEIFQLDVEHFNEEDIQKSMMLIGQSKNKRNLGALQLAADGRIYVAEYQSKYISAINFPDIRGVGCEFTSFSVPLGEGMSMFGLPTFFQDYVKPLKMNRVQRFNPLNVRPGVRYVLDNVHFDFDKILINDSSAVELDKLADILRKNKNYVLEVTGHTDSLGTEHYNNKLSQLRANAIGDFLVKHGVVRQRITCIGRGSKEPLEENADEAGRHENRRVEIVLTDLPPKSDNEK
jgi:outer membrane protein OmpA-like peptidoglycan-associated protein